jgi:hypothetical protein
MTNADNPMRTSEEKNSGVTDKLADVATQAKEKAAEFGRSTVEKVDQSRVATADALQNTAGSLRSGAQSSAEAISGLANKTADSLELTSRYMREHDFQGMLRDLKEVVQRNPGPSLIAAAAFGVLLGAAFRRTSRD